MPVCKYEPEMVFSNERAFGLSTRMLDNEDDVSSRNSIRNHFARISECSTRFRIGHARKACSKSYINKESMTSQLARQNDVGSGESTEVYYSVDE